jgi:hypothetical protein
MMIIYLFSTRLKRIAKSARQDAKIFPNGRPVFMMTTPMYGPAMVMEHLAIKKYNHAQIIIPQSKIYN